VNPKAAGGKHFHRIENLVFRFQKNGYEMLIHKIECLRHTTEIAKNNPKPDLPKWCACHVQQPQ